MRTPKTFIEKDIKAFRNLNENQKSKLLNKLINSPSASSKSCESVTSDNNLSHVCLDNFPTSYVGLREEKMQSRLLDD